MSNRKRSRSVGEENRAECPFTISYAPDLSRADQERHKNKKRKRDGQDDDKRVQIQISPFSPTGSFKTHDTMDLYYTVEPGKRWQDMTRYNSFVLNSIKYYSEGFVYVANESTVEHQKATNDDKGGYKKSNDEWVARILEIRASDEHHVYARVYWMYWPDELPPGTIDRKKTVQGRQPYHGTNELIASNHMDIINVVSVTAPAIVNQWIESDDEEIQDALYWRQAYDCRKPQLSVSCAIAPLTFAFTNICTDKPHRTEAAILNEEKAKEATRPLSPTDAEEKETRPTIDARSGETQDNVHVKEVVRETPLETKNSTPRPTPSKSITTAPAKGSAKNGRKKKTGDYKPYTGLFEANLKMQEGHTATQRQEPVPATIPKSILHAFVELYFEYFDSQFSFLHPSCFEDPDLPWILLLAVVAVGSHYSEIQGAGKYNLALCGLLARAVESAVSNHVQNTDMATVQSVFLLHVLFLASGSHKERIVLQHSRSILATLCWDLLGKADKRRQSSPAELADEEAWQAWLVAESELRLFTCVRVLECLRHVFLGTPLVFNLRDVTRQLPCSEKIWKSRNAHDWKAHQETLADRQSNDRHAASRAELFSKHGIQDAFAAKAILLELYIDDRNISHQLRISQLLRNSFASYLNFASESDHDRAANPAFHRLDTSKCENTLLDTSIDQFTLARLGDTITPKETIPHVIAILRLVPLEMLHSATGWETNKEQMFKSKMQLRNFFQNNGIKARRGLWHATYIFKTTRSSRRLACYDVLSLTVAMEYIYCYCEARTSLAQTSLTPSLRSRPELTRLDQLCEKSAIEKWIEADAESIVHLTGVGPLDGPDSCVRFLRDLEKTLVSQIAWRAFCRTFAGSFAQLRRGETPTKDSKYYKDAE
ncbi:hypothetical protein FMUND_11211 [Fusarium mundagurra]|uniref:BAH domain-containing protein n=1 Tax=Fusarium mundagurra TaxID=1567541 RepID=A0A8H5Y769_9HYPO|nr:hypothetical protein FMUND_11211 [Fusarium mundagurra]